MARHNVILGNDRAFTSAPAQQYGYGQQEAPASPFGQQQFGAPQQGAQYGAPQGGAFGQQQPYGQPVPSAEQLGQMYAQPSATGHDTGRMTMKDALNAITASLGLVLIIGAAVALLPDLLGLVAGPAGKQAGFIAILAATVIGVIGGLVLGLVNTFKKQPSPFLVLAYAIFEGLFLGGLSGALQQDERTMGIPVAAVFATFAVAGTILVLFRLGVLRTSARMTKIVGIAMIAYMAFLLVNLVLGLATGGFIYGGPLGLVIGVLAVGLASYNLVMDFEDVQRGVANGLPRVYAWRCAFGVTMTMVWLYIEIVRILRILSDR